LRVASIIINYKTADLTAKVTTAFLPEMETVGPAHLFLVENDSQDGSAEKLRQHGASAGWGDRVTLIQSPRNGGFGYGINTGVQAALRRGDRPDYVFVLNSDAFVVPGSLHNLVAFMDAHPEVGIAGCPIADMDGVNRVSAFRFPTALSDFNIQAGNSLITKLFPRAIVSLPLSEVSHQADWIPGVAMLIRTEVFEQIGGFDEGFFLYFEELDFCRRALRAGWKSYCVVNAPITHIGSASTGLYGKKPTRMPGYWFDSRNRYFVKHHGTAYATLSDVAFASGVVLRRAKNLALGRSNEEERPHFLRDFVASSARHLLRGDRPEPDDCVIEGRATEAGADGKRLDRRSPEQMRLLEVLREDLKTHDGLLMEPGFWAVAAHRCGKRIGELRSPSLRTASEVAYKTASTAIDWVWGIRLPRQVKLGRRVRIWHYGCIVLEARSIGNDVHIRQCTTFGPLRGTDTSERALPIIEDGTDFGSGACVMGPVTVGRGSVVGANTLVVKDVPPGTSVLGVPARAIPQFGLPTRAVSK